MSSVSGWNQNDNKKISYLSHLLAKVLFIAKNCILDTPRYRTKKLSRADHVEFMQEIETCTFKF